MLVVVAAVGGGVFAWRSVASGDGGRRAVAEQFLTGWARRDWAAMWQALTPLARAAYPEARFAAAYRSADRAAGVRWVRVGKLGGDHDGGIAVPVWVGTAEFGTLRGTVVLPVSGSGKGVGVSWDPSLRLPGLRRRERVHTRSGPRPRRGAILAADGTPLDATALGASIAGQVAPRPTGLARIYEGRLSGRPSAELLFGARVIARAPRIPGRSVPTTIRPRLVTAAASALGQQLGGVAVIRPRDGAVQALAGLAVSAPQPPGSTFKIITASAALQNGVATPSSTYPIRTSATLSGVELRNAGGEACGGSLTEAFTVSCNSVFAPLGAKLGARRLVEMARAFGFDQQPNIPAAKPSTISPPSRLRDDLAVGAAAIGQDRDLATPLEMASVGATIALDGRRMQPRITTIGPVTSERVLTPRVAHQVRSMMIQVVRSGTGTAAAIPGVQVAGKTGTAELRPNSTNPKDTDAWFVAFAPAQHPKVAVAVMLVGAGFGGSTAAPIARQVLQAALAPS
ncbi:MAG TPA: penicillin-binding transpeptidase domain-containing protein [Solirubrobacteraceae bacterium]|nr:penicillin-binding transpeptidase domain-containing protein [Solirubrobacteraceae bacterium]